MLAPHHGTNGRCFSPSRKAEQRWKKNKSSREITQTEAVLLLLTTRWQKRQPQKALALGEDTPSASINWASFQGSVKTHPSASIKWASFQRCGYTNDLQHRSIQPKASFPFIHLCPASTQVSFQGQMELSLQQMSPAPNVFCKGQGTNKGTHWVLLEADWLSTFTFLLLPQCKEMNQHFWEPHQALNHFCPLNLIFNHLKSTIKMHLKDRGVCVCIWWEGNGRLELKMNLKRENTWRWRDGSSKAHSRCQAIPLHTVFYSQHPHGGS